MRLTLLALAVLPLPLFSSAGCTRSWPLVARNAFASNHWCPVNQIDVSTEPGSDGSYRVTGCGLEATYVCGGDASSECHERLRVEFEATDGSAHGAWLEDETRSNGATSREAAIASAAHDLPCDRGSLQVVGSDQRGFANVVDGCGQRVTYQVVDVAEQTASSQPGPAGKHKYVVATRTSLSAPAAPPPPASATPAAPAPPASAAPAAPLAPAPSSSAMPAAPAHSAGATPPAPSAR